MFHAFRASSRRGNIRTNVYRSESTTLIRLLLQSSLFNPFSRESCYTAIAVFVIANARARTSARFRQIWIMHKGSFPSPPLSYKIIQKSSLFRFRRLLLRNIIKSSFSLTTLLLFEQIENQLNTIHLPSWEEVNSAIFPPSSKNSPHGIA